MQSLLGPFLSFLLLYKYPALFLIEFFAACSMIPLPASITLAAAGAFSFQGYFNIYLVIFFALLGNVGGDLFGYFLAKRYGERILVKIGFQRLFDSPRYKELSAYIFNFPQTLIYFTRFAAEIGPAVNILAGLSQVRTKIFFLFDFLGELSYVLLYGLIGYGLGTQWENNIAFFSKATVVIYLVIVIINAVQILTFRRKSKKFDGNKFSN